jgi:hypothetical protein
MSETKELWNRRAYTIWLGDQVPTGSGQDTHQLFKWLEGPPEIELELELVDTVEIYEVSAR